MKTKRLYRPAALILLAASAWLAAAGCTVDNTQETTLWREKLDEKLPPAALLSSDRVLTLRMALSMANANNEQLALSGETYLQALIEKDKAVAALLPSIGIAPSYMEMEDFAAPAQVKSFFPIRAADVSVPVSLRVAATDIAKVAQAEVMARYQLAQLLDLQSDILVQTSAVYYRILQLERQIAVLENSIKVQEARVADMRARLRAGIVRPLDVALTEAEAAGSRAALVDARNRLRTARAGLALLIGLPAVPNPLADDFEVPAVAPVEEVQKTALEHRQGVLAAEALVSAADRGLKAAMAEYLPSLSVDFDSYLARQSFPPDSRWLYGVSLYVPIFSGGRIHADVRKAYSLVRQAEKYRSLTHRQVAEEVEVAYGDLRASGLRLKEYQDQVAAAREAFGLATDAYDAGAATNLERLIAQDRLLQAELQLASEQLNHKMLYLQLTRQTGLLIEEMTGGFSGPSTVRSTAEIAENAEKNGGD